MLQTYSGYLLSQSPAVGALHRQPPTTQSCYLPVWRGCHLSSCTGLQRWTCWRRRPGAANNDAPRGSCLGGRARSPLHVTWYHLTGTLAQPWRTQDTKARSLEGQHDWSQARLRSSDGPSEANHYTGCLQVPQQHHAAAASTTTLHSAKLRSLSTI